jgi:predicted DNA-binding transcriptional regulator AlpA
MSSNPNNQENTARLLRLPKVLEKFPVSKSTWWAGVKDGKFPQPVKLGSTRCTAWRSEDIDRLIEEASDA